MPPPPNQNSRIPYRGEGGVNDGKDDYPPNSKWDRYGDLSGIKIGRGIVRVAGKSKCSPTPGREKVIERETSSSGSNIRSRGGIKMGVNVIGVGLGTEGGGVRGDRVRGTQRVQSDKARSRHQVRVPVATGPVINSYAASSSSSNTKSNDREKMKDNMINFSYNQLEINQSDRSDPRENKTEMSKILYHKNISEGKDNFPNDVRHSFTTNIEYDNEYRPHSSDNSRDYEYSDNDSPTAVKFKIREGNLNESNLITLGKQVEMERNYNISGSVGETSISEADRTDRFRGLVKGDTPSSEHLQYYRDDFEGSDGYDVENEEEDGDEEEDDGNDDNYSDCDSEFLDRSMIDTAPSVGMINVNAEGSFSGSIVESQDPHSASHSSSTTPFGEQERTMRRSLSLATALTRNAAIASSIHREKMGGGRREKSNYSRDVSDDAGDEIWSHVWGSDSDSDCNGNSDKKTDDKVHADSSSSSSSSRPGSSHQTKNGRKNDYISGGGQKESHSDEDFEDYSYADLEEDSTATIQV